MQLILNFVGQPNQKMYAKMLCKCYYNSPLQPLYLTNGKLTTEQLDFFKTMSFCCSRTFKGMSIAHQKKLKSLRLSCKAFYLLIQITFQMKILINYSTATKVKIVRHYGHKQSQNIFYFLKSVPTSHRNIRQLNLSPYNTPNLALISPLWHTDWHFYSFHLLHLNAFHHHHLFFSNSYPAPQSQLKCYLFQEVSYTLLGQCFSTRAIFLRGDRWQCLKTFFITTTGRRCYWLP